MDAADGVGGQIDDRETLVGNPHAVLPAEPVEIEAEVVRAVPPAGTTYKTNLACTSEGAHGFLK